MKKPTSQKTVATQIFWSEFRKVFYPVPKQLGTLTHARQKRCNEQWPCKAAKDTSKAACPAPQTSQLMMFFCLDDLKHRSIWACKKNISKYIYIIIYIYHIYIYHIYLSYIYISLYIYMSGWSPPNTVNKIWMCWWKGEWFESVRFMVDKNHPVQLRWTISKIHELGSLVGHRKIFTYLYGCFQNRGGPPKWMVKIMENPIKMDDLGVPLFFGNTHIHTWGHIFLSLCISQSSGLMKIQIWN